MTTGTAQELITWFARYLADPDCKPEKKFDIHEHREKRSLTQNAYYWQLLSILARKLHMSNARLHNMMLRECAPPYLIDGKIAMQPIPDTDGAESEVLEAVNYHLRPSSGVITGKDGTVYRWYVILRGSSTFSVQEMGALLDRLIEDCKEQGIETLTPNEILRMRQEEAAHEAQKNLRNGNHS